jgi:hypothetical protein
VEGEDLAPTVEAGATVAEVVTIAEGVITVALLDVEMVTAVHVRPAEVAVAGTGRSARSATSPATKLRAVSSGSSKITSESTTMAGTWSVKLL